MKLFRRRIVELVEKYKWGFFPTSLLDGVSVKAIRDPIHNLITFDKNEEKLLLDLLDTKEMQRLRHIKQLGFSSYTYPGAEHTRFGHSLGVTHLTKRFITKITSLKNTGFEAQLQELNDNKIIMLAAALLHDVGHGPFSHALEAITHVSHEKWTTAIITGPTEINQVLTSYGIAPKEIAEIIGRTHKSAVMVKLLSSQLDADRTDYLIRDSMMTGAGYGHFDLEWLINVLRVGCVNGQFEVGLDREKGISIAEDYVLARYYMYQNVYFHKTTRSAEVMMKQAFQYSIKHGIEIPESLKVIIEKGVTNETLPEYLRLNENLFWNLIEEWGYHQDKYISNLCQGIMFRKLYKVLPEPVDLLKVVPKASKWARENGCEVDHILLRDTPSTSSYKDPYLLPIPEDKGEEREASEQIFLFDRKGNPIELANASSVINELRIRKIYRERYYVPPNLRTFFEED